MFVAFALNGKIIPYEPLRDIFFVYKNEVMYDDNQIKINGVSMDNLEDLLNYCMNESSDMYVYKNECDLNRSNFSYLIQCEKVNYSTVFHSLIGYEYNTYERSLLLTFTCNDYTYDIQRNKEFVSSVLNQILGENDNEI